MSVALLEKFACRFPAPGFTRLRNRKLFDWINGNGIGKRILNLGSGIGTFDRYLSEELKQVKFDIDSSKPGLDVIGDAHRLPFKNGTFDLVYSIAVLEHVAQPWIVADEIYRVLTKGGCAVVEVPFLNVIHDAHDYFRFTDKGLRSLFGGDRFEVLFEQADAGGGSFLSVFLPVYFRQFVPTTLGKKTFFFFARYFTSLLKYLDVFIDSSADIRLTANSFALILRKK